MIAGSGAGSAGPTRPGAGGPRERRPRSRGRARLHVDAELTDRESDDVTVVRRIVALRASPRSRTDRGRRGRRPRDPDGDRDGDPAAGPHARDPGQRARYAAPEQAHRDATEALALAERHGWPYLAVQARSTLGVARLLGSDKRRVHSSTPRRGLARDEPGVAPDVPATSAPAWWWPRPSSSAAARRPPCATCRPGRSPRTTPTPRCTTAIEVLRAAVEHDTRPATGRLAAPPQHPAGGLRPHPDRPAGRARRQPRAATRPSGWAGPERRPR